MEEKTELEHKKHKYQLALEAIKKHTEIIAPNTFQHLVVWNIANNALEEKE